MSDAWFKAWGKCAYCSFVGDMWFRRLNSVESMAECEVCGSQTPLSTMPEHPSDGGSVE